MEGIVDSSIIVRDPIRDVALSCHSYLQAKNKARWISYKTPLPVAIYGFSMSESKRCSGWDFICSYRNGFKTADGPGISHPVRPKDKPKESNLKAAVVAA